MSNYCVKYVSGSYVAVWSCNGKAIQRQIVGKIDKSEENKAIAKALFKTQDGYKEWEECQNTDIEKTPFSKLAMWMIQEKGKLLDEGRIAKIKRCVGLFSEANPKLCYANAKAHHLSAYLRQQDWADNTTLENGRILKSVFQWFVQDERLPRNPFKAVKLPKMSFRNAKCILTDDEYQKMLKVDCPWFVDAIRCIAEYGARPSEILMLTGSAYNPVEALISKFKHKSAKKGYARPILVSDACNAILTHRKGIYGDGYLFPEFVGKKPAYEQLDILWRHYRTKLGISKEKKVYGLRHRFATRLLKNKEKAEDVATLLGHKDTAMVFSCYGHCLERIQDLRELVP